MNFDPCGTRYLDGDELLRRLAKTLVVDVKALQQTLIKLAERPIDK